MSSSIRLLVSHNPPNHWLIWFVQIERTPFWSPSYWHRESWPHSKVKGLSFYRNFRNFNQEKFHKDVSLGLRNWSCNNFDDPNSLWSSWKARFLSILNKHAPVRRRCTTKCHDQFRFEERYALSRCCEREVIRTKNP